MRATAADHNRVHDALRRSRIIPGNGIQIGRYSAGTAVSITPSTIRRRRPQRSGVMNLTGWRSMTAVVTARIEQNLLRRLEWRQVVLDNGAFRNALPEEAIIYDCGIPGQPSDLHQVPQYGTCVNLPDATLTTPTRVPDGYQWWCTSQWNPWTPIAGDIIRVYFNRDVVLAGEGFCCCEVKPVREETIFVTYCKYNGAAYVKPELYWLNMSLIGEPDKDGIVTAVDYIYEGTATAGRPRQTALQSGNVLLGGFSTTTNLYTGTTQKWTYRPLFSESYTQNVVWGAATLPSGMGVLAGYVLISGQWKLRLFTEEVYTPSNRWTSRYLETQSSQFNVQHVACDSAGAVHILARNASTGAYRYVTSNGVAEVPTVSTDPCALAISPSGVPLLAYLGATGKVSVAQRINGTWSLLYEVSTVAVVAAAKDMVVAGDGSIYVAYLYNTVGPVIDGMKIAHVVDGVVSTTTLATAAYDTNSRVRMAIDARGYPVVAVSRLVSGSTYNCDLWIWRRDGLNDTYQSASFGNPYQLGAVHVVNGRGYSQ